MNKNKLYLITSLTLGAQLSLAIHTPVLLAQTPQIVAQLPKPKNFGGIPPKRKPAGTRGPCEEIALPFTPVLPLPNAKSQSDAEFSGLTLQGYPTFWFYVPTHGDRATYGRFSVGTEDEGVRVWQTSFKLPSTSGFFSVTLPKTVKALEEGKTYRWTFSLYCTADTEVPKEKEAHLYHTGLIKRATKAEFPSVSSGILETAPLEFYIERQIWYEAAAKLPEVRKFSPQWRSFLDRMDMTAWQNEEAIGALYGNLPQ